MFVSNHLSQFWQGWFCAMTGWACVELAWWAVRHVLPKLTSKKGKKK